MKFIFLYYICSYKTNIYDLILQEIITGAGHTSAVDWWALGRWYILWQHITQLLLCFMASLSACVCLILFKLVDALEHKRVNNRNLLNHNSEYTSNIWIQ